MKVNTKQAIEFAGSNTALAALLGISKGAVSLWGDSLPDDRAKALLELRPEWFPEAAAQLVNELKTRIERLEVSTETADANVLNTGDAFGYNNLKPPSEVAVAGQGG